VPDSRKSKKKQPNDEKQKSLISFMDGKPIKDKTIKEDQGEALDEEMKEATLPQENIEEKSYNFEDEDENGGEIPELLYYETRDTKFGLKAEEINLESLKRESFSSKYVRYLVETKQIVKNLKRGLLLDVDYDGGQNKAYCKFYDLDSDEIRIWIDTTGHEPYCLSKVSKAKLEKMKELTSFGGYKRIEEIERVDLLSDKKVSLSRIYGNTPSDIGGSGSNIKNVLAEKDIKAWEADIRYHLNYIFDSQLIPGLIYEIKNGQLNLIDYGSADSGLKDLAHQMQLIFKDEKPELQEFAEKFQNIFLAPIPDVKRMAMDIEVELGEHDLQVPNPREAKQRIISISFVANDGLKLVYMLEREGFTFKKPHKKFPSDAKFYFFREEKDLLIETFRLMWQYPVVITFNGDNFDLNYMFHRANKLNIQRDLNPIHVKRGFGILSSAECDLRKAVHIDLFNFFFNRSISGYAFGGAYASNSLNAISAALLGRKKYEHEEEIHDMEYDVLAWYNLKDSILTLELTQFNNSLVWNLIILLCRITKMPIHEMVRRQISTWIQNIFYYEHRRKGYLIPRRSEISETKEGGYSKSVIEGKSFQGAYVVQPLPGIHYDVVVMDFACFSDDTDILTDNGWLNYYEIKSHIEDHLKVATINPENNDIEYNPINEIFEYNYDGKMINFKHHGIDILVTPNHRMIYNKRTNERDKTSFEEKISIKTAIELQNDYIYTIPSSGNWKGNSTIIEIGNEKYKPADFLPFLGWFITDGSIIGRSVNIYQSKEKNFDYIRSSLKKLDLPFKEYERNRPRKKPEKIFSINNVPFRNGLKDWFKKSLGKYKRNRIPPEIFTLEKEDLLLLFKSMTLGDGRWFEGTCYSFDSMNKEFADDFQILCLKLGYGCTVRKEEITTHFNDKIYKRVNYRCLISYGRKNVVRKHHTLIKHYHGKVWCPSVNNGTVIVRRNGKPFVSGNSLYPSIIKEYNLSYETVQCPHDTCRDNLVKGIPYYVCSLKMGIFAYVVGFFRDVRVKFFKPKSSDKSLSQKQRDYYQTIQQALKVFINGCLPYNEEVVIKNKMSEIRKVKIGDLSDNWKGKEILSIERNSGNFGTKKFVTIKGVTRRKTNEYIEITLSDGRKIQCTTNHIIPKLEGLKDVREIEAGNLNIGDEILVLHNNTLNNNPPKQIFIPNLIPTYDLWISVERDTYKKFSYKTNESTSNPIINLINNKFQYLKVSKKYVCLWNDLEYFEKSLIENESEVYNLRFSVKYGRNAGRWNDIYLDLPIEFFKLLGWYIAEGHIDKNRITITQMKKLHPLQYNHIISLIRSLDYPFTHDNKKQIRINSNILKEVIFTLCSDGAKNKKIPLELLDYERAKVLMDCYYLGDGNLKEGKWKRYSTSSQQLKNDLVYLIGALNNYCSIVNLKGSNNVYRIIETEGRKYRRKFFGLVDFNGTTPVRIKNIQLFHKEIDVYDIETGNGWFVATNGIIVHNSYGVFGSTNFPLFCLPVAESTTGIGQYSIKQTIKKAEELGVKVLYGDSITGTRCIVIKKANLIDVVPIENFWNECEQEIDIVNGKEIKSPDSIYTLSKDGEWQLIKKLIRHRTYKKIYRVNQKNGETICTEDHSLISEDLEQVKPTEIGSKKILYLKKVPQNDNITSEIIDLFPLINHFTFAINYKNREKKYKWWTENNEMWFGWTKRKDQKKIKRYCKISDLCKLIGIYLADGHGSINKGKYSYKAIIGISSRNLAFLNEIKNLFTQININYKFDILRVTKGIRNIESYSYEDTTYRLQSNSLTWAAFFKSLCGFGSANKHLPSFIYNIDKKYQKVLYEYYLKGDGSIDKDNIITFTSKSLHLVSGLCYLIKSWNIDVSIYYYEKRDVYRIKQRKGKDQYEHPINTKLTEILHQGIYVYDLSVENTEMFVDACGMILLHNTDSIFLLKPTRDQMKEISLWSKEELDLDLEEEKRYQFLALTQRKKNYIGIYKNTKGADIKGLLAKKKNTPEFIKNVFSEILEILRTINDDEGFQKARGEIVKIVREDIKKIGKPGTFPLDDYAINIAMQKRIDKYDKVIPQHVRAAKEQIEIELSQAKNENEEVLEAIKKKYQKGDVVQIIKTKGNFGAKVLELAKLQDIDIKKYKELLISALEQVLDALGITFEEIKGIKKMDAFF
jgi:DNA polymerase elongation subunit (family B)